MRYFCILLVIILLTGCYSDQTNGMVQMDDGVFNRSAPSNLPTPISTVNGKPIYKCEIDGTEYLYWYNVSSYGYYELVMTKK